MSDSIISVENLGKKYQLRHASSGARYTALRDVVASKFRPLFRQKDSQNRHSSTEDFWALKDVSFEVKQGEVLGIIGRNGAGKSTLLKILSRITEPTLGKITLRGRVASLLEVGTGFHPELTGRENIYLNGAILGMSRSEIGRKFDEIVNFSDVERFLDTPVKHYSSGMYMRLAFSVAAHLESEVLVVDEVLAVGDAEFQKRCLGKLKDVTTNSGRTALLVSHNMASIQGLCTSAILLDQGKIAMSGPADSAVKEYLTPRTKLADEERLWNYRIKSDTIHLRAVDLTSSGLSTRVILSGSSCTIKINFNLRDRSLCDKPLSISALLFRNGEKVANLWTDFQHQQIYISSDEGVAVCSIDKWPFRDGQFRLDIYIHLHQDPLMWVENVIHFESEDGDYYNTGIVTNKDQGLLFLNHSWKNAA